VSQDIQNSILEAVQTVAGERLKNVNFTKSYTGIVRSIDGTKAIVEVFGSELDCIIPLNLSSFVGKDDIVIVQDIANNSFKRIVQGVISSINKDMFHIYDPVEDRIVSSVEQLWDEELGMAIDVVLEME
jgi:hypothetical protein